MRSRPRLRHRNLQNRPENLAIREVEGNTWTSRIRGPCEERPIAFRAGGGMRCLAMREGGLEPPRLAAQEPKSCASASSATLASFKQVKGYADFPSQPDFYLPTFSPLFKRESVSRTPSYWLS